MKEFKKISKEDRIGLEEYLFQAVVEDFRTEEKVKEFYLYEVEMQGVKFKTAMSDKELKDAITCTIDMLEELKCINNSGIDGVRLAEIVADSQHKSEAGIERLASDGETFSPLEIVSKFETEKIILLRVKLAQICRVGGAYFAFLSNPWLSSVIFAVYELIVDKFDDWELYNTCAFFMIRGIMHMNSEEIS